MNDPALPEVSVVPVVVVLEETKRLRSSFAPDRVDDGGYDGPLYCRGECWPWICCRIVTESVGVAGIIASSGGLGAVTACGCQTSIDMLLTSWAGSSSGVLGGIRPLVECELSSGSFAR